MDDVIEIEMKDENQNESEENIKDNDNKDVMMSSDDLKNLSLNDNNPYYKILDMISDSGYDIKSYKVHEESSTEKLIDLLTALIREHEEIYKMKMNILKIKEQIATVDVINTKELEIKMNTLEFFSNHISVVLNNLDTLVSKLKKPFMGDYILIEPQNQKNLSDVFYSSVKDISMLKENINNALWLSQINNFQNDLEIMLNKFPTVIATYNNYYHSLIKLDETLKQFLALEISDN
ncbi:hypothetical protein BCR32DRAFT_289414 [Anaeromyces robustus]|uniref:Uncharacterized protein n=1 Tax=Anaeromyces robustus TaxID=1754192 RepID=A0A1Y1XPP6_9FUNG|nr:hypothetical protein BCR32DRAFT_289414 [Anaeromyces robustus]|eukprot:ORX87294.1 hypothetical protein BCR32DRAFT_289414 [Anaeromyces robustus]